MGNITAAESPESADRRRSVKAQQIAYQPQKNFGLHHEEKRPTTTSEPEGVYFERDDIVVPAEIMSKFGMEALTYGDYKSLINTPKRGNVPIISSVRECVAEYSSDPAKLDVLARELADLHSLIQRIGRASSEHEEETLLKQLTNDRLQYTYHTMATINTMTLSNGTRYRVRGDRPLGRGGYGIVWELLDESGAPSNLCVKLLTLPTNRDVAKAIMECIIHAIVHNTMEDVVRANPYHYAGIGAIHGFHKFTLPAQTTASGNVAIPAGTVYYGVIMEKFEIDAFTHISRYAMRPVSFIPDSSLPTDSYVGLLIYQVLHTLEHLFKTLKYNHRDLKCDNIMLNLSTTTRNSNELFAPQYYIIDFGYSRLEYNGLPFTAMEGFRYFVVPMHDVVFFAFSILQATNCTKEPRLGSCSNSTLTRFASYLQEIMRSFDQQIYDKYMRKEYTGDRWREMYKDANRVIFGTRKATYVSVVGSRLETTLVDTKQVVKMFKFLRHRAGYILKTMARNTAAAAPLFFGRPRRPKVVALRVGVTPKSKHGAPRF